MLTEQFAALNLIKTHNGTVRIFMAQWMTAQIMDLELRNSPSTDEPALLIAKLRIEADPINLSAVKNTFIRHTMFSRNPPNFHVCDQPDWVLSDIRDNFMVSKTVERWDITLMLADGYNTMDQIMELESFQVESV